MGGVARVNSTRAGSVEWPTLAVAAAIAAGFAAAASWHDRLPTAVTLVALAVLGAWYNSLQHEVIHGHPTPWRALNSALAAAPLGLVQRFSVYRDSHLAHHRCGDLTDPDLDPESFYVSAETWGRCGPVRRALLLVLSTLAGRLVLGPIVLAARRCLDELRGMRRRAGAVGTLGHLGAVAMVLLVVRSTGLPIWVYVVGVGWGGGALSLLRSFAEHRLSDEGTRSAVVRSGWFFSLLFLNNNLHHTHHAQPWVPWFELPTAHFALCADGLAARGAGLYRGYGEIARRFLVRPFDGPVADALRDGDSATPARTNTLPALLTGAMEPTP